MNAFSALGLSDNATVAEVEAAWRGLRSSLHPDHGGHPDDFHYARVAYEAALEEARNRRCTSCAGSGKVTLQRGFATISMPCEECDGTGKLS